MHGFGFTRRIWLVDFARFRRFRITQIRMREFHTTVYYEEKKKTKFQLSSFNNTHWNYMSAPYWAILGKFLWHRYVPLNWCQQFLHGKIWIYCARKITFVPVLLPKSRSKKKIAFGPLLDFITIGWLIYQNDWGDVSLSIRLDFSELWMLFPAFFFFFGNWMFFPVSLPYSIHLYLLKVDDRDTENLRHIITILKKLQFYFLFFIFIFIQALENDLLPNIKSYSNIYLLFY